MSDMKNYSGNPMDLSWQTAPWNDQDGETVQKSTHNHDGEITMQALPNEVNVDELTDKQEAIIRTAVRDPTQSIAQVAEKAGCSNTYPIKVLSEEVGEWYENTFKNTGKSTDPTKNEYRDDADETVDTHSVNEEPKYPHPDEIESATVEISENHRNKSEATNWKLYAVVGVLGFAVGLLWGGRDE